MTDWKAYLAKYKTAELVKMSMDIDNTLASIEQEKGIKLLSGDHLQIIAALDERLEELEATASTNQNSAQGELF